MSLNTQTTVHKRINRIRKNQGFTLLEALIGFLILSIGMLGIASLQAISLKAGKTSVYGSVAMMKVDELFESMRANPTGLASYVGAGIDNGCSGSMECSAVRLAEDDVFWWEQNLQAGLPSAATTVVTFTAPVPPSRMATVSIAVNWVERDTKALGSVSKSFSSTTSICTLEPC